MTDPLGGNRLEDRIIDFEEVGAQPKAAPRPSTRRRDRSRSRLIVAAALLLGIGATPFAVAQDAERAPNDEPKFDESVRIRTTDDGYALRASNAGGGGAARLRCVRDSGPCLVVRNAGTGGPAFFNAPAGVPPFTVNSSELVPGLNADYLDGASSEEIVAEAVSQSSGGRTPTGPAGGDLTGTYPDPAIATDAVNSAKIDDGTIATGDIADSAVTSAKINNNTITDDDVATANTDGAANEPSLRTLGNGPNQAAAGNDSRFTDSRTPTGPAGGDLDGTYPDPTVRDGSIDSGSVSDGTLRLQDTSVLVTTASITPFQVAANSCAQLQGNSTDIQAGDIAEVYPTVDGTDNALGVQWSSGVQDGDGVFKLVACNNNNAAASAGGSLRVVVYRP